MSIEHTQILSALKKVIEPDLGKDVVSLKLVSDLKVEGNKISFSLQIKNAAMHARKRMQEACEFAIERTIGKGYELEISISALKQVDAAQNTLSNIKNFIAIVSGKGGLGKSTISANIAAGLSKKGYKVGIVDADIYGPSLPIMFDIQHFRPLSRKVNNKELIVPAENYGVKILSIGFFLFDIEITKTGLLFLNQWLQNSLFQYFFLLHLSQIYLLILLYNLQNHHQQRQSHQIYAL